MILLVAAFLLFPAPALADYIGGRPAISDGDTYRFKAGIRIRLFGVDTPEKNQKCELNGACYPCGQEALEFVQSFIGKSELLCEFTGDKTYDRYVASCSVGGKDLGEAIIASGWGFPYREFLKGNQLEGRYLAAEKHARSKRLGLNRGAFIPPSEWRSRKMRLECER